MRVTVLIAFSACLAYVGIVLTDQAAAPLFGELQTTCIGRWTGLALVAVILVIRRTPLRVPSEWLPFVALQGGLDTLGYAAFLAGANTAAPHVTIVVSSAFSVVTVLLAQVVLNEHISWTQWMAIALNTTGTATLAATT